MSSIGIIVKANSDLQDLPIDWLPQPLGERAEVVAAVENCFPANDLSISLELRVEELAESPEPRSISVSGIWGPKEITIIKSLCTLFSARFYDAEAGEFINL